MLLIYQLWHQGYQAAFFGDQPVLPGSQPVLFIYFINAACLPSSALSLFVQKEPV